MVEGILGGWRVASHLFVHANFLHFFWNLVIFTYFAAAIESIERTLLVPIFLISGALASSIYFLSENVIWVGSSGSIFSLMGAYMVLYGRLEGSYKLRLVNPTVLFCVLSITIILQVAFESSWSAGCHLLGFVIGTVLTAILIRVKRQNTQALSVLCMTIIVLSFSTAIFVALNWTNEDSNSVSSNLLGEEKVTPDIINEVVWQIANMNEGQPETLINLATARQISILPLDTRDGEYRDTLALLKESFGAQEAGLNFRLEVLQTKMSRRYARIVATKMIELGVSQFQNQKLSATLVKTNGNGICLVLEDLALSIGKTNALFVATLPYPPGVRQCRKAAEAAASDENEPSFSVQTVTNRRMHPLNKFCLGQHRPRNTSL
jgi:hypothetical protein